MLYIYIYVYNIYIQGVPRKRGLQQSLRPIDSWVVATAARYHVIIVIIMFLLFLLLLIIIIIIIIARTLPEPAPAREARSRASRSSHKGISQLALRHRSEAYHSDYYW